MENWLNRQGKNVFEVTMLFAPVIMPRETSFVAGCHRETICTRCELNKAAALLLQEEHLGQINLIPKPHKQ